MSFLNLTTHVIIKLSLICTCETSCAQYDVGTSDKYKKKYRLDLVSYNRIRNCKKSKFNKGYLTLTKIIFFHPHSQSSYKVSLQFVQNETDKNGL